MKWTDRQLEAIELRNKNMLVAAAAGSGKTAVLVERIKRMILEEHIPLESFLVVTFTSKAAAEMKEKIVAALTEEIEKNAKDSGFLRAQLNSVYKADICTFHAFALSVIRRYYYIIGAEPGFKVSDEAENRIMKKDAADRLFTERFEEGSQEFKDFLDRYAKGRNLSGIKELIIQSYDRIMSVPDPDAWLESVSDYHTDTISMIMREAEGRFRSAALCYENAVDMLRENGLEILAGKAEQEAEYARSLLAAAEGAGSSMDEAESAAAYEAVSALINAPVSVRMIAGKDEKEGYAEIKDSVKVLRDRAGKYIKEVRDDYFAYGLDEYMSELEETKPYAAYLCLLIKDFRSMYDDEKREKKLVDFSDIEHMALAILDDETAAEEYRRRIAYIYIDEYQDSNPVQEALIDKIKRENNVFMVGDVKQSIYKFRLAEPELFMEKYTRYKNGADENSVKLDLNTNFRSKAGVIETVNRIFSESMDGYDDDAALHMGISGESTDGFQSEMHLLYDDGNEDIPDEIAEMKLAEREAHIAADIIKKSLGSTIYDVKRGEARELKKRDIVILMRGVKNTGAVYQKVLSESNIPCYTDESDGYFDTIEIDVFLNILKIVDNSRQDTELISALYSPVFGFTADELAEIRVRQKQGSYYSAFENYAESGDNINLAQKCMEAKKKIEFFVSQASSMPLADFIWKLMWDTGYYSYAGGLPAGKQRQANLRTLADRAAAFSDGRTGSIYEFLRYIDNMKERGVPTGQTKLLSESDDVVRIMTIHKSKGLEYPMVILAGLGKRFNYKKDRSAITIHKDIGIGLDLVNPKEHWHKKTIMQKLIYARTDREFADEELRILYVGCTRAMDKLVMLGSTRKNEKQLAVYEYMSAKDTMSASSFLDIVLPAIAGETKLVLHGSGELAAAVSESDDEADLLREVAAADPKSYTDDFYNEIDRRLSYEYPYAKELTMKSKYSVTELAVAGEKAVINAAGVMALGKPVQAFSMAGESSAFTELAKENGLSEDLRSDIDFISDKRAEDDGDLNFKVPLFIEGKRKLTAAETGTLYHSVIEHIDFERIAEINGEAEADRGASENTQNSDKIKGYIENLISDMAAKEIILDDEAAVLDSSKIAKLIASDIGKRMAKAALSGKLEREMSFTMKKIIAADDGKDSTEILVQGIIDCLFKEINADGSESYIIVDYKTNYARTEEDEAQIKEKYRGQIELYKEAVRKTKGAEVSEAYLYLISSGKALPMQ